jgi:hypothetical protein
MSFPALLSGLLAAAALCAGADEARIVFEPYKHVIWIPVRVNGGPELRFAFDSAAAKSAIDWDRAEQLKIPFTSLGEQLNAGSGDGATRVGRTGAVRVSLPGATLDLPTMGVVPLRGVSESYGRAREGVVGAELLARYVVEMDWEAGRMALHEPAAYRYAGDGASVPLVIAGGMPFVRMKVSVPGAPAVEGLFLVDCPHPGTIIMNRPFVEQNGLLEAARRSLPRMVAQYAEGVGGKSEILHGRIAELKLGPYSLREPVVGFSQARAGALARSEFAGILGAEILRRFRVIVDYSRERMILEPKASFKEPYRYDASGIRLRSSGTGFREYVITGIAENSPAAKANLQEGDRLTEIGGKAAKALSLGEISELLKRDGATEAIKVQRGSQVVEVSLALRSLI